MEAGGFFGSFAGGGHRRDLAMEVLARHCARMGPVAARGLEDAVRRASEPPALEAEAEPWLCLQSEEGLSHFQAAKSASMAIYSHKGRTMEADSEARRQLGTGAFAELLGDEALEVPFRALPPRPPVKPEDGQKEKAKDELILLPISAVRFAHNNQSEHFVHGDGDCCILQLAVELVAGLTPPEAVPLFTVCRHADQWYCRSGNRRLAALSLAALFAPERFHCVWVRWVATDSVFLHGKGGRPKLTTHLNGADCEGRWLIIKETGEAVGCSGALKAPPYGSDLLSLLPRAATTDDGQDNDSEEVPAAAGGA